jgi:hypothetical protein
MACGSGGTNSAAAGGDGGSGSNRDCTPSEVEYAGMIRPILEARCAHCHGTTPDNGAPFSLLEYDRLVADDHGSRVVDRMLAELGAGRMPPAGQPRPTPEEFDTLVDWLSCGTADVPYTEGLIASAVPFAAPSMVPDGLRRIDLTAEGFLVPAGATDQYERFVFRNLVTEDQFVRRIDATLDQRRVVHHATLHYANDGDTTYLYAWAPGTGAVQFPDGGLRVKPTDAFYIEIHYNNPGDAVADASGISMFVGPPTGTEYGMSDPNTFAIYVPPLATAEAVACARATEDFRILAGMPHMHEIGSDFLHDITRLDGTKETLIELHGWSFDSQFFYSLPAEVRAGEEMTITCTYQNPTDTPVTGGIGTTSEMCYNFMYITPPKALRGCN